jgi:hypothetical protein
MRHNILEVARQFLRDMAAGKMIEKQDEYYALSIEQIEFPNRLNSKMEISDYETLLQRSKQGEKILTKQAYEIQKEYVVGNTVIMEVIWKGAFSIPVGETPPGRELKAYFAVFLEFNGSKIVKQRNYDCFEPF